MDPRRAAETRKLIAPELIVGVGVRRLAGRYAHNLGARKVLLVTDPGVAAAGWPGDVISSFDAAGLPHVFFDHVTSNPRSAEVMDGASVYVERGCDLIVSVGGGSPTDCAKAIGIVAAHQKNILELEGVDELRFPIPPLICVPTTLAGADVSQYAIITDEAARRKFAIISKALVPDAALGDPETLTTLPADYTMETCYDALSHAFEAYLSNGSFELTDLLALHALRLLWQHAPRMLQQPADLGVLRQALIAGTCASFAFSNAGLGVGHAIAHALGGLLDTAHGACIASVMGRVAAFNAEGSESRLPPLLAVMGVEPGASPPGAALGAAWTRLARELGVADALGTIAISPGERDVVVANAMRDPTLATNPREVTPRDVAMLIGLGEAAPPKRAREDTLELRDRVIGLGERSMRKSYYPSLLGRMRELERANRALRLLSSVGDAVLHARDGEVFLREIVNRVIRVGGYVFSWIGALEVGGDGRWMARPIAWGDPEWTRLEMVQAPFSPTELGRGARTIDCGSDPVLCAQPALVRERRIVGGVALPLRNGCDFLGALHIYSSDPTPFLADEVHLLEQLAADVAFGVVSIRERARRARAEAALIRERSLFMAGITVVFTWKAQEGWPVEYVSENVESWFGYSTEAFTSGKLLYTSIIHPDDVERREREVEAYAERHVPHFTLEYRIRRSDGQYRWVYDFTMPVRGRDGVVTHYRGYVLDNTEQRIAKDVILQAKQAAEIDSRAKTEFLNIASHELRTPLTSLRLLVTLASRQVEQGQAVAGTLVRMQRQLERLTVMVNDLLDVSRLDRGTVSLTKARVDMVELVQSVAATFELSHPDRMVVLELPSSDAPVMGDAIRLEQVLDNLLDNAAKYSEEEQPIHVRVVRAADEVEISVTDRGIGIPQEALGSIFQPFYRIRRNAELQRYGLGLGLYIAAEVVRLHGGRIGVESERGEGSRFFFCLPVA